MAVHNSATTDSDRSTSIASSGETAAAPELHTISLRERFGMDVPIGAGVVTVEIQGDASTWVMHLTRRHRWTVEGASTYAEVTAVYDDCGRAVDMPERVPDWIERVVDHVDAIPVSGHEVSI